MMFTCGCKFRAHKARLMIVPLPSGVRPIRAKRAQHGQRMFDSAHEKRRTGFPIRLRHVMQNASRPLDDLLPEHRGDLAQLRHQRRGTATGVSCCGPSESAFGGLGCTSIMMESAPGRHGGIAPSEGTRSRCAGRMRHVDAHRIKQALLVDDGHGRYVQREARGRLERADAALAQHHVLVALGGEVVGGGQPLGDGAREAALVTAPSCATPAVTLPMFFSRLKFWKLRAPTCRPST